MRIYECADAHAMSRRAANIISAQVIIKPDCVLGLATGSTPIGAYSQLVEWYKKGDLSFAEVKTVNLDEYLGLAPTHEQSYRYFMQSNLFDHVDVKPENTHVLNGMAPDPEAECAAYNELIRSLGGIDLHTHLYTVEVGPVAEDAAAGARRHDTLRDGVHRRHVHRIVGMAEYILVAAVVTIGDVAPTHTSEVAHELIGRGVGEVGLHQLVRLLTHESAAVDHGVLYRNQHNESSKKQEECGYVPPELQGHDIAFKTNQIDII